MHRGTDELAQTLNSYLCDILEGKSHAAGLSGVGLWGCSGRVQADVLGSPVLPPCKGWGFL